MKRINEVLESLMAKVIRGGGATDKQSLRGFELFKESKEKLSHPTINCTSGVRAKRSFKDFCERILNFRCIGNEGKRKIAFTLSCKTFRSRLLRALHSQSHRKTFANQVSRVSLAHSYAFTLAEVLVTLSIIGVVATVTISSIYRVWFDAYSVSAVRNAYAVFDSAIRQMFLIEGRPMSWNWPNTGEMTSYGQTYTIPQANSANNRKLFAETFSKYLRVTKLCYTPSDGCFNYGVPVKNWSPTQYWLNGTYSNTSGLVPGHNNNEFGMILANGMHLSFFACDFSDFSNYYPQNGGYRGMCYMRFDINGPKGPNRWGYDIFAFDFDSKGVILDDPSGVTGKKPTRSVINGARKGDCVDNKGIGKTCALWIMRHGNVDYKYRNVSSEW